MILLRLIPAPGVAILSRSTPGACCSFCHAVIGSWSCDGACGFCHLVLNLGRPRIDEEATLCWLPELSQAVVSRIVHEQHRRLANPASTKAAVAPAHFINLAFADRTELAAGVVGTRRPSELSQALMVLPPAAYADRHRLLGGIRVVPTGRLFDGDTDISLEITIHASVASSSAGVN